MSSRGSNSCPRRGSQIPEEWLKKLAEKYLTEEEMKRSRRSAAGTS
jgi:uncharacterized protein with von Willebrand factor type A (vWA) domain